MHKEMNYLEWKPADTEKHLILEDFRYWNLSDTKNPVKFQNIKEKPETEYRTERFVKESDITEIKK